MQQIGTVLSFTLAFLFQTTFDYGTPIAAMFAAIGVMFTAWGAYKQKRLEKEIANQNQANENAQALLQREINAQNAENDYKIKQAEMQAQATREAVTAWQTLSKERGKEMDDMRVRLRISEHNHRLCEKGTMKLVIQLVQAKVPIDANAIIDGLSTLENEMALHVTEQPNSSKTDPLSPDGLLHPNAEVVASSTTVTESTSKTTLD